MTAKLPPTPSAENFKPCLDTQTVIKLLNDEFDKFEAQAKNCDRYTIVDVKLPVRIIELFLKLFQICVDNPVLRQNIDSVELFAKIFLLMRTHFKAQCPCGLDVDYEAESDEDNDDDWDDCCESDPLKKFFHYISLQHANKQKISLEEMAKKKLLKDVKHVKDWLMEQNGILICEICNSKCINAEEIVAHSKLSSHEKNLKLYKENEIYAAFPFLDIESFACKACKSEYSTFSSLVKHFEKSRHKEVVNNILVYGIKSNNDQANGDSTSANAATNPPTKVLNQTDGKNFSSNTSVMIKYKAKKVTNVETTSAEIVFTKTQEQNTTSDASKPEAKSVASVSTKPQVKIVNNASSKTETKLSNNNSSTLQSKNTTNIASKNETKPSSINSTASQAKNNTNGASKSESKISAPNKKTSIVEAKVAPKTTPKPEYNSKFIVSKDSSGKYCQICDRTLPDEAAILAHVKSADHLKSMSTFEANQEFVKTSINCDNLLCILCGSHFSNIHELAHHFEGKKHVALKKSSSNSPPAPAKPVQKPVTKNILKNTHLSDTDKKYFKQKENLVQCIVCDVTLNKPADIIDHINSQQHSQNVLDCIKHEEYFQLPGDKMTSFNCSKCASVFNSFNGILTHCKDHIISTSKPKPVEPFKLKKSDEKFISKGKTEKSSRCNLCDKELPTDAALISHTGSTNHIKNSNVIIKNEPYFSAGKTSCSLCEHACQDLASLVKHFKTDTHQKAAIKGKKPLNQTSVHIPSYAKPKLDQMIVTSDPVKSPKLTTPKKDKKTEGTPVRKSRLQVFPLSDADFEELTSREQFPMIKPDNSFIIAKNDVFYCRICNVDLPAVAVAAHMNGATHRINTEVFESLQCHVLSIADCVQCTLCKVTFEHVHQLVKHFREKIHTKPATVEKPKIPEPPKIVVSGASENDQAPKPTLVLSSSTIENKLTKNPPVSPLKPVKILKSDRKHIFRLAEDIVQCNLCNTKLLDNEALESHVNNLNHKRNSTVYQENESLIKQLDSIGFMFECTSCAFSGDLNKVIKHCKKKQHLTAKGCDEMVPEEEASEEDPVDVDLTIIEFDLKCICMKNGLIRCKICHSKLTGEKNLLEHMNSINHRQFANVYKSNEPFIEQFDEYGYSYKCTICEVIFTRLDTMIRHFSDEEHVQKKKGIQIEVPTNVSTRFNVTTYNFECSLCSMAFCGFADFSKHCYSPQHEILKNSIQLKQTEMPYNITITDYVYHCNACDIRLINKSLMEKHQKKRIHDESATFFKQRRFGEPIIEIVGYEYLCNLCWFPMYSAAELTVHERSNMHKSGKNFDDVWSFNEKHLIMCDSMYKVRCKLCLKTIGIEKLIKHCTSRDHRLKFIANHLEESSQDQYIVWRNAMQYCTLCDCKLINNHNLVNHVNSEKHKSRMLRN